MCEAELLRSLQESRRCGEEYMRLKKVNDDRFGRAARVINRDDQPVKDAMGAWQWHAENVRTQAAAIGALLAISERIRQDAERRDNPEVPGQRPALDIHPGRGAAAA